MAGGSSGRVGNYIRVGCEVASNGPIVAAVNTAWVAEGRWHQRLAGEQLGGGVEHDEQGFAATKAGSLSVGEQAELEGADFGGADGDGDARGWARTGCQ